MLLFPYMYINNFNTDCQNMIFFLPSYNPFNSTLKETFLSALNNHTYEISVQLKDKGKRYCQIFN